MRRSRRAALLVLAAGVAAPLFAAPASASIYCGSFGPVKEAFGPICTVKCAYNNPPVYDPSHVPPVYLPDASCYWED